jgi:hypothetical protein
VNIKCAIVSADASYLESTYGEQARTKSSRLSTYQQMNTICTTESGYSYAHQRYLQVITNVQLRQSLSRFRCSNHRLEVKCGRHAKPECVPRRDRICRLCSLGAVEDEDHLLLVCPAHHDIRCKFTQQLGKQLMSQPHFGQVWGWSPTLGKVEDLESSGTFECSELDNKAQNTLHWGVLEIIRKVLKRRYRKWPRIGHSDICSPSYGQKKGRESNWQFDSRALKVGNRPLLDARIESATWRWKDLDEGYNFGLDLVAIELHNWELWPFKVPGVQLRQFRDSISRVPTKCAIWM